jgi:phage N-6-adenine-methyltransferase
LDTSLHFSTGTDKWTTPDALFQALDAEFHFTLDAAAESHNTKCREWFGPDHKDPARRDALTVPWSGSVWLNSPYSRPLQGQFVQKAFKEWQAGRCTCVLLLPARTDTRIFHSLIWNTELHQPAYPTVQVRFLKGRLKFGSAKNAAPFPSMLVVLR